MNEKEKSDAVIELASIGLPVKMIERLTGISKSMLYEKYRAELEFGKSKASASVAKQLYNLATNWNGEGDVPHAVQFQAAKYWATTQMGWSETAHITVEHQNVPVNINFVTPQFKELNEPIKEENRYGKDFGKSEEAESIDRESDQEKQRQIEINPTFIRH